MGVPVCLTDTILDYHMLRIKKNPSIDLSEFLPTGCWGDHIVTQINNQESEDIKSFSKEVGHLFEKVVNQQFLESVPPPFSYTKVGRSIIYFLQNKESPLVKIAKTFHALNSSFTIQAKLIEIVVKLAFAQDVFDPDHFVSHGFNHSLNVADFCQILYRDNSVTIAKTFNDKYDFLEPNQIKFLISLLAYLHDCGYPHLKDRAKANHAIYSADQTDLIKEPLISVLQILNGNKITKDQFDTFYKDLRLAIFSHNADVIEDYFDTNQETDSGHFLYKRESEKHVKRCFDAIEPGRSFPRVCKKPPRFDLSSLSPGRRLDLFYKGDKMLGSERIKAVIKDNPFHIIRIADNLDFAETRFSDVQRNLHFRNFYHLKFKHYLNPEDLKLEQELTNAINEIPDNDVKEACSKFDGATVRHFGGCEAVKKIQSITIKDNQTIVSLEIDKVKWNELSEAPYKFSDNNRNLTVANFQMYRATQAFSEISLSLGSSLADHLEFVDSKNESLYRGGL